MKECTAKSNERFKPLDPGLGDKGMYCKKKEGFKKFRQTPLDLTLYFPL